MADELVLELANMTTSRRTVEPGREHSVLNGNAAGVADTPWPEIVDLVGPGPEVFPVEVLPPRMRAMVEAVAASSATPIDFPAGVALGVVASLAARAVSIRPTGGRWTPPANLYFCAALASGEGKSQVHRELLGPLHEIESAWQEELRDEITAAKTRKTIADQLADKAAHEAGQGKKSVAEAVALAQEAAAMVVPPTPRLLTMEPTPEAVARICGLNGGTIAVVSDEGAEVFQLMSRYSAGGSANLGIYLSGFEGDPWVSDRASRESPKIDRLVLSLVLAIQPGVLDDLGREKANRDRGLLARFLLCIPTSRVGSRPTRRPEVPSGVRADWSALLQGLARQVHGRRDPVILELDEEAQQAWWSWCDSVEPRLDPDTGDLRHCVDWGSKAQAHVARLSALLHLAAGQPLESYVSARTMSSAIACWEYFATHARRAFVVMHEPVEIRLARKILRWIERSRVEQFTQREAWKGVEGGIASSTEDVITGLTVLVDRGYVRPCTSAANNAKRPGRPTSQTYLVNPALLPPITPIPDRTEPMVP